MNRTTRVGIDRPVFILGCNRSGTTLLFRNLSMHPYVWSLYIESQEAFYRQWPVDPVRGDRVVEPADADTRAALVADLHGQAHNKERFRDAALLRFVPAKVFQRPLGKLYKPPIIRLVEKTPANTLRVPMLARAFPDAKFLFLVRRGEDVVSSLMEGWKNWSGTPAGEDWRYTKWHYLVPPYWQEWTERPLQEICVRQWAFSTTTAHEDLERWAPERYLLLRHEELISEPVSEYQRIVEFCDLRESSSFNRVVSTAVERVFTTGGSRPRSDKWKRLHYEEVLRVRHVIEPVNARYYDDPEVA